MLVDQKNRKAWATGGDILLANGQKIPLPGGFALPTTGLWSNLLDIPEVRAPLTWQPARLPSVTACWCRASERAHATHRRSFLHKDTLLMECAGCHVLKCGSM